MKDRKGEKKRQGGWIEKKDVEVKEEEDKGEGRKRKERMEDNTGRDGVKWHGRR